MGPVTAVKPLVKLNSLQIFLDFPGLRSCHQKQSLCFFLSNLTFTLTSFCEACMGQAMQAVSNGGEVTDRGT